MRLVGLVGRSRVGKDTAAGFLADTHTLRRLAQPVKDACKVLYGWTDLNLETELKEIVDPKWKVTPREAMVHMTKSMQGFMSEDFFARRFFDGWDGTHIVIPDVRYAHDVDEIHRLGGITIKITRLGGPSHEFEAGVDSLKTTYEVSNDGTLFEFRNKIDNLKI